MRNTCAARRYSLRRHTKCLRPKAFFLFHNSVITDFYFFFLPSRLSISPELRNFLLFTFYTFLVKERTAIDRKKNDSVDKGIRKPSSFDKMMGPIKVAAGPLNGYTVAYGHWTMQFLRDLNSYVQQKLQLLPDAFLGCEEFSLIHICELLVNGILMGFTA